MKHKKTQKKGPDGDEPGSPSNSAIDGIPDDESLEGASEGHLEGHMEDGEVLNLSSNHMTSDITYSRVRDDIDSEEIDVVSDDYPPIRTEHTQR